MDLFFQTHPQTPLHVQSGQASIRYIKKYFSVKRGVLDLLLVMIALFGSTLMLASHSGALYQSIAQLNQFGSVLYVAAHPDDENTRALSYLSRGAQYRTAYLSLTRGDGGQNLIGSEQGEELGVIRTQELLEARRIDGATQFFSRAYDFGYSKTPDETLDKWNKNEVLYDIVWVIRKFKPDVIISRFPTTGEGGHGHHTASAMLIKEAFEAAADSTVFPDQLNKVTVWKATRLLWNTFNFSSRNTTSPEQFQVEMGGYNPVLGKSYGEIAALSRSQHSSQGFGTPLQRRSIVEYFVNWKGVEPRHSLMDGVDTTWTRCIKDRTFAIYVENKVHNLLAQFDFNAPYASIPDLVALQKELQAYAPAHKSPYSFWVDQKLQDINRIMVQCAGIHSELTLSKQELIPGDTLSVSLSITTRLPQTQVGFALDFSFLGPQYKTVIPHSYFDTTLEWIVPAYIPYKKPEVGDHVSTLAEASPFSPLNFDLSHPYWLRKQRENDMFYDPGLSLLGLAENPTVWKAGFRLHFSDPNFSVFLEPELHYKHLNPSVGEVYAPVFLVPPVVVTPVKDIHYFNQHNIGDPIPVEVVVKSYESNASGKVLAVLPKGWTALESTLPYSISKTSGETTLTFWIEPSKTAEMNPDSSFYIHFYAHHRKANSVEEVVYNRSEKRIQYPHIREQILLNRSVTQLAWNPIEPQTAERIGKVAYIQGSGDKVMETLLRLGLDMEVLPKSDWNKPEILEEYRTIIVGIRAFNTHGELYAALPHLMDYVESGGRLLVQYQTQSFFGPLKENIGPYPLQIGRGRVTDETAEVHIHFPKHPLFNSPFSIEAHHFDGWVQERGLYFANPSDSCNYQRLFSMSDPNEALLDGSVLYAQYGKGSFIYTGLSFFRQLPAAHSGATQLFVNFIYNPELVKTKSDKKGIKRSNRKSRNQ